MKLEYNCDGFRSNLQKLLQADKYCDIILVGSDGKAKISAHRVVLAAFSPYFANQILDSDGTILKEIVVEAIDGATLQKLVDICYSGSLDVDENSVSSVHMAAIYLQLNTLLPALDDYIMTLLDDSNCLHFYKLAEIFSRSVLFEAAEKYICEHFIEICDQPSFFELDAVYLNKLFCLEQLNVPSAEDLFLKVIKWIQHTPDGERDGSLAELLPNLKLSLMSEQFLMDHVNPLCKTVKMKNLVTAVLVSKPKPIPREPVQIKCDRLLVVAGYFTKKHKIMEYSFEQQKWSSLVELPTAIQNYAVVYSMTWNSLCFVGGTLNNSRMNDFLLWNLQSKKFMKMVNLPTPRFGASVISLNDGDEADGDLIVVGGHDGKKMISTVERWRCESCKWNTLKSTKARKSFTSLVRVGHLIYCVGGPDINFEKFNSVECYNPTEDSWSTLAPLHESRCLCGIIYDGGKVYVIGGSSNVIECYDPDKNEWAKISIVDGSWKVRACVRYNGCIVAFGENTVLISDGDWKTWKKSDTIPTFGDEFYGAFSIPRQ